MFGKGIAMKKKRRMKGIFAWLLVATMAIGAVGITGCGTTEGKGGNGSGSEGGRGPTEEASVGNETYGEENSADSLDGAEEKEKVMGRYLESVDETLKGEVGSGGDIAQMEDGRLVIMSGNNGKWVSKDDGATWER